jgi:hypothetical protein
MTSGNPAVMGSSDNAGLAGDSAQGEDGGSFEHVPDERASAPAACCQGLHSTDRKQ